MDLKFCVWRAKHFYLGLIKEPMVMFFSFIVAFSPTGSVASSVIMKFNYLEKIINESYRFKELTSFVDVLYS